ncbi:MAG: type II secretion system F family protein [Candidatus Nanoarchaeia archaeon]
MNNNTDNLNTIKDNNFFSKLCHTIYVHIGSKLLKNKKFKEFFDSSIYTKKYEDVLQQANLRIYPEEFFISSFLFLIFAFSSYVIGMIALITVAPELFTFPIFFIGIFGITVAGIAFYNYPYYISKQREGEIDAAIPHVLPYMKLLSSDLTLSDMIKLLEEFTAYKELRKELEKIRYYNHFMGVDLISAIRISMKTCPSKQLSELFNDIIMISNSGGDVYSYMNTKVKRMNEEIESTEKQTLESVMILSQIYIVFLLIGPLLAAVVLSVFSFISFGTIGSSAAEQTTEIGTQIIYFVVMLSIVPPLYFIFYLLVYMVKPAYSKIKEEVKN